MSDNPFAVGDYASSGGALNDANQSGSMRILIDVLVQTRPWVRLIGFLTLLGAVLMILVGVAIMAGAVGQQAGLQGFGSVVGVLYIVLSVLYLYPGLCLIRYASAISEADSSGQMSQVVEALTQQKKFWKFCGIFAAIILGFYAVIFGFGILAAVFG